jgi:hypothetical protein
MQSVDAHRVHGETIEIVCHDRPSRSFRIKSHGNTLTTEASNQNSPEKQHLNNGIGLLTEYSRSAGSTFLYSGREEGVGGRESRHSLLVFPLPDLERHGRYCGRSQKSQT